MSAPFGPVVLVLDVIIQPLLQRFEKANLAGIGRLLGVSIKTADDGLGRFLVQGLGGIKTRE